MSKDELSEQKALNETEERFMGFLETFFKKSDRKNTAPEEVQHEKSLEEIWEMEDETELIVTLGGYVAEKCQYGDEMSALSEPERVLYVVQGVEMEVNNGGFSQYFFNSSGDLANEAVDAFKKIGAVNIAEICKKAVSIYGRKVPADRDKREKILMKLEDKGDTVIEACDDAFYDSEEDLIVLSYEYVMQNKDAFV